jgi:3-hydroxybutyryl-CoA dehydratase
MDNQINKGSIFEYEFVFDQADVELFAKATGDFNPIHLDKEYASNTIFKKPIIHGFLGGSVFSKVFGTMFPGEGTIYLKQSMAFYKPMYVGENYKAVFTVLDLISGKKRALVKTEVFNGKGVIVIDGEALIQHNIIGN